MVPIESSKETSSDHSADQMMKHMRSVIKSVIALESLFSGGSRGISVVSIETPLLDNI